MQLQAKKRWHVPLEHAVGADIPLRRDQCAKIRTHPNREWNLASQHSRSCRAMNPAGIASVGSAPHEHAFANFDQQEIGTSGHDEVQEEKW